MDPLEFERLMARYFSEQGYRVEHVGTGGTTSRYDGGIDLQLYRGDEHIVVQCKRSTVLQVTHNPVHELLGVMHTEGATGAIFITSGEFTSAAVEKMRTIPNFRLIEGHELRKLLGPLLDSISQPATDGAGVERDIGLPAPNSFRPRASRELPAIAARRPFRPSAKDLGPPLFVAAVVLVLIVSCVRHMVGPSDGKASIAKPRNHAVQSPQAARSEPVVGTSSRTTTQPTVVVDVPRPRAQTPAEARAAKQRADEAMRVIEATTPEM